MNLKYLILGSVVFFLCFFAATNVKAVAAATSFKGLSAVTGLFVGLMAFLIGFWMIKFLLRTVARMLGEKTAV